jgi:hypothetical protein
MRRIFIALAALALALVVAAPAGAVKPNCDPDDPNYTPDHPTCASDDPGDEVPFAGTMCDPAEYPAGIDGVQTGDFTFTLAGKKPGTCIDVISDEGIWEVTVTGEGARYLGLVPRDSIAPGDSCGGWLLRTEANIYKTHTFSAYGGPMPAATINACGTEWAEWVDVDLPGLDPAVDCVAVDGDQCLVADALDIPHPLAFHVFMQSGGGSTTFHVDLPPLGPDPPDLP